MKKIIRLSEIKKVRELVDDCWRGAIDSIAGESMDFTTDNEWRFIHTDHIDEIMNDELLSDKYTLGCFNSWFLADVLNIDIDVIDAMQKAEAFEAIGKLIVSMNKIDELQKSYVSADGYGHHFSHYDGNEYELGFKDYGMYHVFRIN